MRETDTQFKVVLEDEVDGDAELKFDIQGANYAGVEQQESQIDYGIGDSHVVLADMIQVYHGTLVEGGSPTTLIVMKFEFQVSGNYKRFKNIEAKMTFLKGANSITSPEIPEETTHTVSPSVEGGGGPVKATAAYTWQFKKTVDKESSARIIGTIRALGMDRSKKNTAIWTLLENPDTSSGIPTLLQTAVLLKRERTDDNPKGEKFKANLEIHGEADKVSSWKEWWKQMAATVRGKAQKGEGVIFNPEINRGIVDNPDNLKYERLEKFGRIVTLQEWKDGDALEEVGHGDVE